VNAPTLPLAPAHVIAFRSSIVHFLGDPDDRLDPPAAEFLEDGLLVVADGHVHTVGETSELLPHLPPGTEVRDYSGHLILPGFVDTHVHYAQTDIIASYGTRLLDWLERYTFPAEARFADPVHARQVADFFVDELLRQGTTTALVFTTVHRQSVEALFEACREKNLRIIAGKVMMDRNCPESLRDTAQSGYDASSELMEKWHHRGRALYAVTPRFAPTSTEAQLERAGELVRHRPDAYLHTHLAESPDELPWVTELFPWSRSYLDVYDRFGLLRPRAVYAHCIYLDARDRQRLAESGGAMSFCPTSNLFLGSGLFDIQAARQAGARVGIGTDVGAGTSFSLLATLNEAYKVSRMAGRNLTSLQAFYLATLGGARALYLDDRLGNFATGKEADFVVLDLAATPLLERRLARAATLADKLFALMMLGDDRCVVATYVMGALAHARASR
jgi:guanine deaminase